jgi:hypothetical protein
MKRKSITASELVDRLEQDAVSRSITCFSTNPESRLIARLLTKE